MSWTRLVRFEADDGKVYLGQPVDESVDPGTAAAGSVECAIIEGSPFDGKVTSETKKAQKFLSPLTRDQVSIIRCLGLNYQKHQVESGYPRPNEPLMFIKPRTALAGPGEIPVPKAAQDDQLDFETELAVVIGRDARDVPKDKALEYVLGYANANDLSARKHQTANSQICFGKGLDNACPIGPVIVSASKIKDPQTLNFEGRRNGKVMQADNTNDMIFDVATTIAHCSQGTTLERGSIILMGTPKGVGWFCKPRQLLGDGDKFEIWHDNGLGTLVNTFKHE